MIRQSGVDFQQVLRKLHTKMPILYLSLKLTSRETM
jgi:hypothetical protein